MSTRTNRSAPSRPTTMRRSPWRVVFIEKVTGKAFEVAVQELLLDPVGLKDSYYFVNAFMTRRFVVVHNDTDGKLQVARPWPLSRSGHPAGAIASTAADG